MSIIGMMKTGLCHELHPQSGPGIYKVTVTDDEGRIDQTGGFEVIAHTPPVIASAQVTLATCATAGDGAIALTVSGGAAPYTYAWSHGANTASIQNLNGAAYCVTVTDANNCPVTACYSTLPTTPQDAAPYVKRVRMFAVPLNGDPETKIYDGEWVTTAAGCIFFTGGTLESTWITIVPENIFTQAFSNNTLFDEFFFMGQDLNGNPLFDLRLASENLTKCADIPQRMPNCSWHPDYSGLDMDDVHVLSRKCLQVNFEMWIDDGRINATATGGTGPYSYVWTNAMTGAFVGTTQMVGPLTPGRYCVKITDTAGCSREECVTFCSPLEELLDDLVEIVQPCPSGAGSGSICIETGNSYPLVYQWQNGTSGECISNLTAGSAYCLTVTDLACPQPTVYCTDPLLAVSAPLLVQGVSNPACPGESNGRLSVIASGGRPPYSFLWSNGVSGPDQRQPGSR
jgi:hypothetical protein